MAFPEHHNGRPINDCENEHWRNSAAWYRWWMKNLQDFDTFRCDGKSYHLSCLPPCTGYSAYCVRTTSLCLPCLLVSLPSPSLHFCRQANGRPMGRQQCHKLYAVSSCQEEADMRVVEWLLLVFDRRVGVSQSVSQLKLEHTQQWAKWSEATYVKYIFFNACKKHYT